MLISNTFLLLTAIKSIAYLTLELGYKDSDFCLASRFSLAGFEEASCYLAKSMW